MAVSRALRRLLRIRELEEEQNRLALESTIGELNRLEHALTVSIARDRQGRRLVQASAQSGELPDRLAGLEETRSAVLQAEALGPRIDAKGEEVKERRQEFLMKRVERRQAETLIKETEARDVIESDRREQQALDDLYSSRQHREGSGSPSPAPAAAGYASQMLEISKQELEQNENTREKT